MPPATSPGSQGPRFTTLDRAQRVRFRRAVMLMVMTLVAPGSAQLAFGNRKVGRIALRLAIGLGALTLLFVAVSAVWPAVAMKAGINTMLLQALRLGLIALAVGWALLFFDAWRLGQPLTLQRQHRLAVVGVNGFLSLTVAGTLLFGAHVVGVYRGFVLTFDDSAASAPTNGRYNVLLLGGDSGAGRWGLRPDSMTVASIDAETGKTVLISLPRNMQNFPFAEGSVLDKEFPDGFDAEGHYLNSLATWALDHPDLFEGSKNPGVDATVMGVEGITGLDINYWAMVNLEGFKDLVDAFGGVELNVRQPIPVGLPHEKHFHYIEPGVRTLNGHDTLWFARAREGSDDYSRMARQKCVMNAMLQQVSPTEAVRNVQAIADASSAMLSTDLPRGEIDRFAGLAMKARSQKLATLSLVPPMINTADPDIELIHAKVAEAIARAEGNGPARKPAKPGGSGGADAGAPAPAAPPSVTGGSVGSLSEGYAANQAEDLGAVC
jgi:LCP family protein required for cell wall assembly